MTRALTGSRAALTWLVATAAVVTAGLLAPAQADAATKTYTATTSVNVRTGPSTAKSVLTQLQEGAQVVGAGAVSGDWLPITYGGVTAYAWADYLKLDKVAATVVTSGPAGKKTTLVKVDVRATAGADGEIVSTLAKGVAVHVTGLTSGAFSQVTVSGKTRWVLTASVSTAIDTTPDVVAKYTLTGSLALRATASVTAANQGTIASGATVGGTGTHSGTYSQVVYSGKVGWVITGYLKAVAGTPSALVLPLRKTTLYVATAGAVLRAAADAESSSPGSLGKGFAIRTTGTTKNGFTQVIWAGSTAWIATTSLSLTQVVAATALTDLGSASLNKLQPYAKAAVLEVRAKFPQIKTIYGWRSSSAYSSDHPNGRAIDNMIPAYKTNKALGDALAQYFIDNAGRLHVNYVIWRQRTYTIARGSWVKMADRGGDTANHMNHVHVSFKAS